MIRSLSELGMNLRVLPGRKIVILFTGGLPSGNDLRNEVREAIDTANKSGVAFYPVDVRPVFAQTDPGSPSDSGTIGRLQTNGRRWGPGTAGRCGRFELAGSRFRLQQPVDPV